jgi:hypothetical protein
MSRVRLWPPARFLGAAVSLALVAACGTHHPAKAGAVDSAFLTKANLACESTLENTGTTPFPYPSFDGNNPPVEQLPAVGSYFDGLHFSHQETAFVKSFGTPRQGQSTWSSFVELVDQQQALVEKQITTAKASDKAGFTATVTAITTLETRIATAGHAVGFQPDSYCMQLF